MHRKSHSPILGRKLPTGLTWVVIAKVHSQAPKFNWAAATAADDLTPARDSVTAVPLLTEGGVPRQLQKIPRVIDPEPRFVMVSSWPLHPECRCHAPLLQMPEPNGENIS